MNKSVKRVLWGTLAAIVFAALLWLGLYPPSTEKVKTAKLPETTLTMVESETSYYGSEEVNSTTCYLLLNDQGDTLSCQWVPYESIRGIVYMRGKGVFDCRGWCPVLLVKETERTIGRAFRLSVSDNDEVMIQDLVNSKEFVYDLKTSQMK